MADWKYVMFQANDRKIPIIFPNGLIHNEVADAAHCAVRQHVIAESPRNWSSSVVSAGFLGALLVSSTHGRSESMDISSREDDRAVINLWPYDQGRAGGILSEAMFIEAVKRNL